LQFIFLITLFGFNSYIEMDWSHILVIVLILLIVLSESAAMATLKKSGLNEGAPIGNGAEFWFIIGALMYVLVAILLRQTFKYEKMGVINGLWSALSVIAAILVGKLVYGESLQKMEIVAIGLATVAAIILGK